MVKCLTGGVAVFTVTASIALVAGQEPPKTDPGEQIVSSACTTCHDLRPIETQALDEAGWAKEVKANIDRGAKVSADESRPCRLPGETVRAPARRPWQGGAVGRLHALSRPAAGPERAADTGGMAGDPRGDAQRGRAAHRQGSAGPPAVPRETLRPGGRSRGERSSTAETAENAEQRQLLRSLRSPG